ncbi:MAG TPA: YcaO-like family protein [Rhodopila sp.]
METIQQRLRAAAIAVTGADTLPEADGLLRYLGYDDGDATAAPGRARMMQAAASFRRLFRLPVPDAPGLVFFGAEADPARLGPHNAGLPIGGVAGSGLQPKQAFESCVGEGIEYLSQFADPGDPLVWRTIEAFGERLDAAANEFLSAVFSAGGIAADRPVAWVPARRLTDGSECWFPADLCLRRAMPDFVPPLKLSTGCAAGVTRQDATRHGLLELIERDAVALWWRGGRRPRRIVPDSEADVTAAELLAHLRYGQNGRTTSLLDITTDLGIPVVAAFSARADGYGFACGLSARTTLAAAARSAIFEMCQAELSLHVIETKRHESGQTALNDSDRRQIARSTMLDTRTCALLQPEQAVGAPSEERAGDPVTAIVAALAKHGIVACSLDLTRPRFGVPVMRVIAPGLQPEPCAIVGERLANMIKETGGGARHSGGIALL